MIRLQDVHFQWPSGFALGVGAFAVEAGGRAAILGPSGSGKSTLLGVLSGELLASGTVEVGGASLGEMSESQRRQHRLSSIGMVLQDHPLVPQLSLLDNVLLPFRLGAMAQTPRDVDRARRLLEQLEVPSRPPDALSQGERQRVAIARALVTQPAVLLADEPTSGLDDGRADAVVELLEGATAERGMTLVMVTHDRRLQDRFAHQLRLGQP